jgi:beta-galactosidase GanA
MGNEVYAYERTTGGDKVVVVLNRSDLDQTITLQGATYTDLLNGGTVSASSIKIPARSSRILK